MSPPALLTRYGVSIFRVVSAPAGLFFVVAVVLMASTPWVQLHQDQEERNELDRRFLNVAGIVDAITATFGGDLRNAHAPQEKAA